SCTPSHMPAIYMSCFIFPVRGYCRVSHLDIFQLASNRYRDHQPPLSFPTRRSSDLGPPRRRPAAPCRKTKRANRFSSSLHSSLRDRKSTRLNSSHVKNSYAVFCLKKKKLRSSTYFITPQISIQLANQLCYMYCADLH